MFREHAKLFNRLQFVADILITCAAFPLAFWSRLHLSKVLPADLDRLLNPVLLPIQQYLWIVVLATVCWAAAASSLGLYRISIRRSSWGKVRIALESSIIVWLFLGFLSFALKLDLSRPLIALFIFYQAAVIDHFQSVDRRSEKTSCPFVKALPQHPDHRDNGQGAKNGRIDLSLLGLGAANPRVCRCQWIALGGTDGDVLGTVADLPQIIENNIVGRDYFRRGPSKPGSVG